MIRRGDNVSIIEKKSRGFKQQLRIGKIHMSIVFETFAPWYNTIMRGLGLFQSDAVMASLDVQEGDSVVDLGGGTGYYAFLLAQKGAKVVVVDESESMLSRVPHHPHITPCCGDIATAHLDPQSFDIVLLIDVLHHVKDVDLILTRAVELLKKGGRLLVLDVPKISHPLNWMRRLWEYPFAYRYHFFTQLQIEKILSNYSLVIRNVVFTHSYYIYLGEKL